MAGKARLFSDHETAEQILAATDPKAVKALGRKARGFDADAWDREKFAIVREGSRSDAVARGKFAGLCADGCEAKAARRGLSLHDECGACDEMPAFSAAAIRRRSRVHNQAVPSNRIDAINWASVYPMPILKSAKRSIIAITSS